MALLTEVIRRGTRAAQPAATAVAAGTIYFVTDELVTERSTGAAWESISDAGSAGAVATDAIWDAAGDLAVGSGANTASRLAVGTNDKVLMAASGEALDVKWDGPSVFKFTFLDGQGNWTTTSTSFVAVDATDFAYLTLDLAIGDVVRCTLVGQAYGTTGVVGFDFEVDQPTSANTRLAPNAENGLLVASATRSPMSVIGLFTATEAGVHGFRPMWRVASGTGTLSNATSSTDDTAVLFTVEKLGAVRA